MEKFPSIANLPPGDTLRSKLLFFLRTVADLQVASVLQKLVPWLSSLSGNVLEVGCGAQPYRHYVPKRCTYTGLDWENSEAAFGYKAPDTVYYNGGAFPFPDNSYDNVFHTEVIEHVYHTESFFKECKRVLKDRGEMFFSVPFSARFHYIPYDYWRYTPSALRRLLEEAGFCDIQIIPRGNDFTVFFYKALSIIYRWFSGKGLIKVLAILFSPLAFLSLIIGHLSLRTKMGSDDDCLGYTVKSRAQLLSD
ncbi:MAG: methyltransferase domain-containing protein [Nitrospirae bacterium]|nr:methyltransferase domain-containing protein [Nitrospirota bacterium]